MKRSRRYLNRISPAKLAMRTRSRSQVADTLDLDHNKLTGGLEPLRGCTALDLLYLDDNKLTGGLEPLRGCTALHILQSTSRESNNLAGGLEPLRGCSALEGLELGDNQLVPSDEDTERAHARAPLFR